MNRRTLLTYSLAGLLAPLLVACGDKRTGGTVRIQMPLPENLEPATLQTDLDAQLAAHAYSGLVMLNAEGEPIPDLAQRWAISPDGRTYQFPLRPGLRFHSGEQIAAEHVKDSWERALDPEVELPGALRFLGKIAGVARYRNGLAQDISGIRAVSNRNLEVELNEADLTFPAKLTHPHTYARSPAQSAANGLPAGSGPFSITEWIPGELLNLARSEDFYGFEPMLDRIEITGGVDAESLDRYARDELDILYVGVNDLPLVLDRNNPLNKDLHSYAGLDMTYLAMNNRLAPFNDEGVRQAFAFAIDRAAIVEQVFSNTVGKATSLLPPALARTDDAAMADFDVFKARQALSDSRYRDASNLPEITFTVPGTRGPAPATVLAMVNMVQQHLGVSIQIQREPWATFLSNLERRDNPHQLFLFTWHADYPDPQAVLDPLFRSNSLSNNSGYVNPEVDNLLLEVRGDRSSSERQTRVAEIERRVTLDSPVTPLWHSMTYLLIKPSLQDVQLSPSARPWLNRVYLES